MNKKEFNELPVSEQRVLLAQDVLNMLEAGKLNPVKMHYVRSEHITATSTGPAKVLFEKGTLDVCAKGSLAVAWILRFGGYTIEEFKFIAGHLPETARVFGPIWHLVESIFEGSWVTGVESKPIKPEINNDDSYFKSYSLKDIMGNIVENGGNFKFVYFQGGKEKIRFFV